MNTMSALKVLNESVGLRKIRVVELLNIFSYLEYSIAKLNLFASKIIFKLEFKFNDEKTLGLLIIHTLVCFGLNKNKIKFIL